MTLADPTKRRLHDGDNLGPQTRSITLAIRAAVDAAGKRTVPGLDIDARTLEISFSSEEPVARWFGIEVLSHDADAPDFSRLNDGAPMLFNHNMDDILGVVEKAWIGPDKRGHAIVRFANTPRGQEMLGLVADGIVRNVSFMYRVDKYRIDSEKEDPYYDDDAIYTATRWLAYEVSMVSIPADQTVGVGRSAHTQEQPVVVQTTAQRTQATPAAPAAPSTTGEPTMNPKRAHVLQNAAETQTSAGGSGAAAAAPVDLVAVERQRVADIVALCRKHNLPMEKTHEMISSGVDIAAARGIVLDGLLGQQGAVASLGDGLDMTDREKRNYSLIRAVQALTNGNWQAAGFEREVSQALAKRMGKAEANSFFMPTDLPFAPDEKHARTYSEVMGKKQTRAAYQVGTASQGGNLVATNLMADNFIEVLRNASVTAQLGARYLTDLTGNVDIPRQNGAANLSWVGESTAGSESEATFDKVSLKPKTITAWSLISRLMMLQSSPAIEMLARADLLAQCALGIDLAAMSGSGAGGQPTGIVNQSGVSSIIGGANGANLSFDHIIQMYSGPRLANAPQANLGFAINSKAFGYLSTLKATTGQYLWMPQGGIAQAPGDTLRGYPYAVSNQLRSALSKGTSTGQCSELIYGNWLELLIGMWGVMEIAVNPYDSTGFKNGDVVLRVMQTCDIGVRHGASFAVMTDALTPGF
ncbi:phage major capsid protein [Limnohabitans sp.]|uniref:phage major capsid protein n=1 Tax=Limnohabitans sp. TaxID=1907725 RepID=UPI00286F34D2|nr:phage major capsid protein [Limnohabitans sp.]